MMAILDSIYVLYSPEGERMGYGETRKGLEEFAMLFFPAEWPEFKETPWQEIETKGWSIAKYDLDNR